MFIIIIIYYLYINKSVNFSLEPLILNTSEGQKVKRHALSGVEWSTTVEICLFFDMGCPLVIIPLIPIESFQDFNSMGKSSVTDQ